MAKVWLDIPGRRCFLIILLCFASEILSCTAIQPPVLVPHYQQRRRFSEGAQPRLQRWVYCRDRSWTQLLPVTVTFLTLHTDLAKTSLSILPAAGFFLQLVWFYWQTCLIPSSSRYCWCYPFSWKSLEKLCLVPLALQETFQLIYQSRCKMNYATAVFLLEKWHRQILSQDSLNSCFTGSLECLSSAVPLSYGYPVVFLVFLSQKIYGNYCLRWNC